MSKQLATSAAFSILAMAAFALSVGGNAAARPAAMETGATTVAAAPASPGLMAWLSSAS